MDPIRTGFYKIIIVENENENIIGSGYLAVERKFFRNLCRIGHISSVEIFSKDNEEQIFNCLLDY